MKRIQQLFAVAAIVISGATSMPVHAQGQEQPPQRQGGGRGNFDPEQMRQRMLERLREQMSVTNDDEWKLISERISKVSELRLSSSGLGGMFGRGGGGRGGPDAGGGGNGGRQRSGGSPESDALRAALEAKAPASEIKTLLAKLRESRKANEAKLEKAQEELRAVLNVNQEAVAVVNGLLK